MKCNIYHLPFIVLAIIYSVGTMYRNWGIPAGAFPGAWDVAVYWRSRGGDVLN